MQTDTPQANYDVIVVGGGLVGASFALDLDHRLQDLECSVLVVEAVSPGDLDNQPSFDARSTALSFASRSIYEKMGLWKRLEQVVAAIEHIEVSDQGHFGSTQLDRAEQGVEALGYVVENRELGAVLNQALMESPRLQFLAPARISTIQPRSNGMRLKLLQEDGESEVSASLVVLADGGRSPICGQLGIEQSRESYGQCAVITNIAVQKPHQNLAFERFTASGPLAVLPLTPFEGQNRCSVVWTVDEGKEKELVQCDDAAFISGLSERFGSRLGKIEKVGQRFAFPLTLTQAREQIRPGLVLLGNVAHTLHPVAGQGLNLSLRDSAALADTLKSGIELGQSVGDMGLLQSYLDSRTPDQRDAILFTDQMTRLFSSKRAGQVLARKAGLLGLDLLPALRKQFALRAMGTRPR